MVILYNIGIRFMYLAIRLASIRNKKAKKWISGRRSWEKELKIKLSENSAPIIWFHISSLGEYEQARPVIEGFKSQASKFKILVTFFSPSGYELRKDDPLADITLYLPLDTKQNAQSFLELVKPKIAFFVRYEFWYHFIHETSVRKIPLVCISAHFRKDQIFFKLWGGLFRKMIHCFDHIFVQDKSSVDLIHSIGYKSVSLSGDTRIDRVKRLPDESKPMPDIARFIGANDKVLVAGSIWPEDINCISTWINEETNYYKIILAPHEIDEPSIEGLIRMIQPSVTRFSKEIEPSAQILILDTIGQLAQCYRFASIAFVGGAFKQGLHNILEPAAFGKPILFGPNTNGFPEADDIIRLGGARSVSSPESFRQAVLDAEEGKISGASSAKYIADNKGAAEKILAYTQQIAGRWKG